MESQGKLLLVSAIHKRVDDNNPEFTSVVYVAGSEYGSGKDTSTKKAEKRAAEDALQTLGLF
jgi:dsRNA-specific ribonuclease